MHDLQSRISAIASFFLTVLATQFSLVALLQLVLVFSKSAIVVNSFEPARVKLVSGRVGGGDYYMYGSPYTNLGVISFDLDAAIVEFTNSQYHVNQAVIWDDLISDKEDAVIVLKNQRHEYQVHDLTNSLANSKANLTLQLQVVPWVGVMRTYRHVVADGITFPDAPAKKG